MTYNDEKYNQGLALLAEQIVAMIKDDEYSREDYEVAIEDYVATTADDIVQAAKAAVGVV